MYVIAHVKLSSRSFTSNQTPSVVIRGGLTIFDRWFVQSHRWLYYAKRGSVGMGHVCRKVHAWHDSGQLICIVQRHTFRARSMRKEITVLRRCSGDDRAARRSCAIRSWLQLGLFDCGMIWGMLHASMLTFGVSPLVSIVVALVVGAIVKLIDAVKPAKG